VEGQETANLIGGYSTPVFPSTSSIQVEIKNSGISSEYGGALGGVGQRDHEEGLERISRFRSFTQFENDAMDANQISTVLGTTPKIQSKHR